LCGEEEEEAEAEGHHHHRNRSLPMGSSLRRRNIDLFYNILPLHRSETRQIFFSRYGNGGNVYLYNNEYRKDSN
jgi:hypothetical protein